MTVRYSILALLFSAGTVFAQQPEPPAARPITLRDLLTFRLGTGLVFAEPDKYPI